MLVVAPFAPSLLLMTSSSSSSWGLFLAASAMRISLFIGSITLPILVITFGAANLRAAVCVIKVDVTGALIVDSNAAADLKGKGRSSTCDQM